MQLISREECLGLVNAYRPYPKVPVINGTEKEEKDKGDIPNFIRMSTEIYTDAYVAENYITIDIYFKEYEASKIARVLLI